MTLKPSPELPIPPGHHRKPLTCLRPGCGKTFSLDARAPHKKFCSKLCYHKVRAVRKRLRDRHKKSGCPLTLQALKLLRKL